MAATAQKIALLGSTGSIGEQTLAIARLYPDLFEILVLTSHTNWAKLAKQAVEFMPDSVVIADKQYYPQLKEALKDHPIKVYAGADALAQIVANGEVSTVVNAIVGYAGLEPTIAALESGKKVALANKESLVVAGDLVMRLSAENRAPVIPVDSEHSAIFQCLAGETSPIKRLLLTASGGPFLDTAHADLHNVSIGQALAHPKWKMGRKITIDSATMMNKGFEVIEAHWLFGTKPSQIEVVVHPESIVHSLVEFADGAMKAQLGIPDMRVPIQYALTFPHRLHVPSEDFDITRCGGLTFRSPDTEKFPCLALAYGALERGGNAGCVLNAANEVAVGAFFEGRAAFTDIPAIIEKTLAKATHIKTPSAGDYRLSDAEAREIARQYVI